MEIILNVDQLPTDRPIIIYGAGKGGRIVLGRLAENTRAKVEAFVDAAPCGAVCGVPVIAADAFMRDVGDRVVVIASQHYREIAQALASHGVGLVFNAYPVVLEGLLEELRSQLALAEVVDGFQINLYRQRALALATRLFGPPEPVPTPARKMPDALRDAYAMGGRAAITERYRDDAYPQNHPLIYTDVMIDACLARVEEGKNGIYGETDVWLRQALAQFPVAGREVGVVGSISPWYEAICLAHEGRPTTVDYNPIISESARLRTMTLAEWSAAPVYFDDVISISSIEHDGLGRYGDPLDPDGDIKAMAGLRRMVRPGGRLFLAVPIGRDQVAFNAHRIYGRARLPLLLQGWSVVDHFGFQDAHLDLDGGVQPVFVLTPAPSGEAL